MGGGKKRKAKKYLFGLAPLRDATPPTLVLYNATFSVLFFITRGPLSEPPCFIKNALKDEMLYRGPTLPPRKVPTKRP